ncbi:hypothetical protein QBC36DRAFT_55714 [Triangularia setosa]|uniref:Uncharacterized protein n=1 Tax=Triangularia setosa TaxID=2587417 RepID=A0AAN7A312_9PEZI|nr:hypothetical protein QBC36DRAFT_55714 [Podospora setosa]
MDHNFTEFAFHRQHTEDDMVILGQAFLSQLFLTVEYDCAIFSLANIQNNGLNHRLVVDSSLDDSSGTSSTRTVCLTAVLLISIYLPIICCIFTWMCFRCRRKGDRSPLSFRFLGWLSLCQLFQLIAWLLDFIPGAER